MIVPANIRVAWRTSDKPWPLTYAEVYRCTECGAVLHEGRQTKHECGGARSSKS